jgi:hypothetical protein
MKRKQAQIREKVSYCHLPDFQRSQPAIDTSENNQIVTGMKSITGNYPNKILPHTIKDN